MEALIIVGVVLAIAGFAYLAWYLNKKRIEAWQKVATSLGLSFSHEDPFGLEQLPFGLFSRGDGRGFENVAWGTWNGLDVKAFEFWYYEETTTTDSQGRRQTRRDYSRFTCALTPMRVDCPSLSVSREGFFSRLADQIGFRDIEFESEEFNKAYQVKSPDRRFASYVIDARMMRWLLDSGKEWSFEMLGPHLLCQSSRLKPEEVPGLLAAMKGFSDSIPEIVWETYGGNRR